MTEFARLSPLVVIAGNGSFPLELAKRAKAKSIVVSAICHIGETEKEIESYVENCLWIKVGQLNKILAFLKSEHARTAVFSGGISRVSLFKNFQPDLKTLGLIARIGTTKDDAFLRAVCEEIEKVGVRVIASNEILNEFLATKGTLTKRDLTPEERADAQIGWAASKSLGALDLGQTAVAAQGTVVALECIEGTDRAILRGGELSKRKGCVVVKTAKPQQDLRLDLPSIGTETINSMVQAGATALILEHERAMILSPDEFISLANRHSIAVRVISAPEEL